MTKLSTVFAATALSLLSAVALAAAPAAKPAPLSGTIGFVGSKVTGSHTGDFKKWSGSVTLAGGKAEGGKLEFTVQTASVVADEGSRNDWTPKLEEHLKGADFFDTAKFPTATFASTEIKAGGTGGSHTVKGNLTLRGVTKVVSFPATIVVKGSEISGKTEFSINRKDFGLVYAGKADDLIRDGVVLKIDVKASAK
jgi:polyisoprenoid-binding protein YceI